MSNRPGRASQGREDLGLLRQRVDGQVSSAQEYIEALRQDIAHYRRENEQLTKQRNRWERTEASLDVARLELSELSAKCQAIAVLKDQLQALLHSLAEENDELASRCEDLESSLVHERESRDSAKLEIRYLQEQVEHLESMLDLLASQPQLGDKA